MRGFFLAAALTATAHAQQLQPSVANVTYAVVGAQPLALDLYLPPCSGVGNPLVVYIHGGGWFDGDKAPLPRPVGRLLEQGIAVASINYRLTSQAAAFAPESVVFPAQIHDVKGAVRWLRAHAAEYCIDPQRIAAWGHSAGGHLATMLGVTGGEPWYEGAVGGNLDQSSRVKAVVDYAATMDVLTLAEDVIPLTAGGPGTIIDHQSGVSWGARILGIGDCDGTPDCAPGIQLADLASHLALVPQEDWPAEIAAKIALARALNPTLQVSDDDPPLFVTHGDADDIVPFGQSLRLVEALSASAVPYVWRPLPGEGHRVFETPELAPVDVEARAFLASRMPLEFVYHAPRRYCLAGTNSTGAGAHLSWAGSTGIFQGNFQLTAQGIPAGAFALTMMGAGRNQAPFGAGFRCLANPLVRLVGRVADDAGRLSIPLNFGFLPGNPANPLPGAPLLGSHYYFQIWYRDLPSAGGANLSDGLEVQVTL